MWLELTIATDETKDCFHNGQYYSEPGEALFGDLHKVLKKDDND
jgi:hypothetical protein